ncbi:MAG: hypothetical protein FJ290_03050 [Planctomycetes bacterium]|nr:hypothetical protein [Planctomycetota bacterium]
MRFAHTGGPPPAGHGAGAHPHVHHYHRSGAPVGLIVGIGAGAVAVLILVLGIVSSRPDVPTLAEFKAKLRIPREGLPAGFKMSQVDFVNRAGDCRHHAETTSEVWRYYDIQGGTAVVVLDRSGWEVGEARIRRILIR